MYTHTHTKNVFSFLADLKKGEDDFMGRAFYRLQTIPVDGEQKTLSLYSHSGKSNYGTVRLSLNIRGLRENVPVEISLIEHKMLVTAVVNFESRKVGEWMFGEVRGLQRKQDGWVGWWVDGWVGGLW